MSGAADALVDAYDAALFDLDGVVYLGPVAVPGAAEGIAALRQRDVRLGFVTNNAARPPAAVAEHLRRLDVPTDPADVVTAAQAAAHLLRLRFGAGAVVLAVGGVGVETALAEQDLVVVHSADDDPVAVMQGWGTTLTWEHLNEAAIAIHRGAHWVATNTDPTRPTDRGLVPGNGAAVAAVRMAVVCDPEVAGKPFRPLLDESVQRLGAARPIFVGDRLDTDVAGARAAGLDSLLVLTGSSGGADLLTAGPQERPTHLGYDLRALLAPARPTVEHPPATAAAGSEAVRCREQQVELVGGNLRLATPVADREDGLDALWAAAQLAWAAIDAGGRADPSEVLEALAEVLSPVAVG